MKKISHKIKMSIVLLWTFTLICLIVLFWPDRSNEEPNPTINPTEGMLFTEAVIENPETSIDSTEILSLIETFLDGYYNTGNDTYYSLNQLQNILSDDCMVSLLSEDLTTRTEEEILEQIQNQTVPRKFDNEEDYLEKAMNFDIYYRINDSSAVDGFATFKIEKRFRNVTTTTDMMLFCSLDLQKDGLWEITDIDLKPFLPQGS